MVRIFSIKIGALDLFASKFLFIVDDKLDANDQMIRAQLFIYHEDEQPNRGEGYLMRFDTLTDWELFKSRLVTLPLGSIANRHQGSTSSGLGNLGGTLLRKSASSSSL